MTDGEGGRHCLVQDGEFLNKTSEGGERRGGEKGGKEERENTEKEEGRRGQGEGGSHQGRTQVATD